MKFNCTRNQLAEVLAPVLSVVPSKSTLPILSHVYLRGDHVKNCLHLSATDLDLSLSAELETPVSKDGAITVPARTLADLVREIPEGTIQFEVIGGRLELRFKQGHHIIAGTSAEEFPSMPDVNLKKAIRLPSSDLLRMIRKTIFAVSRDETRPALNGVLWETQGESMVMVATDGHRMAKIERPNTKLAGVGSDLIIPPKILDLVVKYAKGEEEIGVVLADNHVIFDLGRMVLTSRLIEGPYPNYRQVIPKDTTKRFSVDRDHLFGTVRRVSILSNALTHQVRFSFKDGELELRTANADLGAEAKESLEGEYEGDPMDAGYNATYMLDILKQIDSPRVQLDLNSSASAALVRPEADKDAEPEDYLCLIMPLRLSE
jgi:DNA polymerase-3 subunit beta